MDNPIEEQRRREQMYMQAKKRIERAEEQRQRAAENERVKKDFDLKIKANLISLLSLIVASILLVFSIVAMLKAWCVF